MNFISFAWVKWEYIAYVYIPFRLLGMHTDECYDDESQLHSLFFVLFLWFERWKYICDDPFMHTLHVIEIKSTSNYAYCRLQWICVFRHENEATRTIVFQPDNEHISEQIKQMLWQHKTLTFHPIQSAIQLLRPLFALLFSIINTSASLARLTHKQFYFYLARKYMWTVLR